MLLKSYPSFEIQDDEWLDLNTLLSIPVGTSIGISNSGAQGCYVYINTIPPVSNTDGYLITKVGDTSQSLQLPDGIETVWIRGKGSRINSYLLGTSDGVPEGLYEGTRAMTIQDYVEANVKLGVQHEGSVLLTGVAGGASNNTIFLTGALPVSLKGRRISYSGVGVSAFIYEGVTYTGGTSASYQNASAINPVVGLSSIIVGAAVVSEGTLIFSPIHSLGNTSTRGKGSVFSTLEAEHILKPNTAYLLRITSLDTQVQNIASHLSWYEGELDLPRP